MYAIPCKTCVKKCKQYDPCRFSVCVCVCVCGGGGGGGGESTYMLEQ